MAKTLAYDAIQCKKLCICHGGLRPDSDPADEWQTRESAKFGADSLRQAKSTTYLNKTMIRTLSCCKQANKRRR